MTLDAWLRRLGLPADHPFARAALPALRLRSAPVDRLAGTRLGGRPDLPDALPWPRWEAHAFFVGEARRAREKLARVEDERSRTYWRTRIDAFDAAATAGPRPLAFLAQLDCAELPGSGLPAAGLLSFFYDLAERPWGYDPLHAGAWRVVYTATGTPVTPREPPDDLDPKHVLGSRAMRAVPTWTLPDHLTVDGTTRSRWTDRELDAAFERRAEVDPEPWHQVSGHPDALQGDMAWSCALVTAGVDLGQRPRLPPEELARLAASAPEWTLVLQLASDREASWGDAGRLFYWIRRSDLAAGAWDRAWLQLQSG